ncbi:MAG: glycosyltransferase family 2 protein [Ignavibacteriales bacterium]|nr:glycosyltransferase family 2 protein [Ignavibacteriales bacterium]
MKVTIITIVLNNVDTIISCMDSVMGQTYKNIEYIVIDGGSTDGTIDILRKYNGNISQWISEPDNGVYYAMNKGVKMATGDIIGFLNADDYYADNGVIQHIVDEINLNKVDSCYGDVVYVKRNDLMKVTRYWKSISCNVDNFKKGWFPPHPTFFVKKNIYDRLGVFNTDYKFSSDVELMIRFLCKHSVSTCYIPDVLIKMRDSGKSNKSLINIARSVWECYLAMKNNNLNVTPLYLLSTLLFRFKQIFVK